eukprot:scaffold178099_cov12-Tisochrysis_lutea.AAC.1
MHSQKLASGGATAFNSRVLIPRARVAAPKSRQTSTRVQAAMEHSTAPKSQIGLCGLAVMVRVESIVPCGGGASGCRY